MHLDWRSWTFSLQSGAIPHHLHRCSTHAREQWLDFIPSPRPPLPEACRAAELLAIPSRQPA